MSASPTARQAVNQCQAKDGKVSNKTAPKAIRRVQINSASELPAEYGTTPGGSLFSTTPGGTRIVYERNFIMNLRNSPLSNEMPKIINNVPGVVLSDPKTINETKQDDSIPEVEETGEDQQFDMEL